MPNGEHAAISELHLITSNYGSTMGVSGGCYREVHVTSSLVKI